jgi:molecular chaperone DnaJ
MDFYLVLGVDRDADLGAIKRSYKRLARKCHPDINPGDRMAATRFRQIAEAYETLSDAERRRRYDVTGSAAPSDGGPTSGFEGFDFTVSISGNQASTFGDLFADVLNRRGARRGAPEAERGADLHQSISTTFDEAIRGSQQTVTVTRQEHCAACHGTGRADGSEVACPPCRGSGIVTSARGHMVFSKPCAPCGGSGRQRPSPCPSCRGLQVRIQTEPLTIAVPPGLADGACIRVPGKGHAGPNGGGTGDLYITVHVLPHDRFRREGDDLHVTVAVAVHEAALGAKIEVPSLEGPQRLRVPPGTQAGQRFRLRERGVASPRDGRRGDLVVEVRLVLPRLLDERSKELLREFGRINAGDVRAEAT